MDGLIDYLMGPDFARLAVSGALVCLLCGIIALVGALLHYGRGREGAGHDIKAPWVLIMATWRDSFVITLLYLSGSFIQGAHDLLGSATAISGNPWRLMIAFYPFVKFFLYLIIFAVAYLRVIAISTWLRKQADAG